LVKVSRKNITNPVDALACKISRALTPEETTYPLCTLYEGAVLLSRLVRVIEELDVFGSNAS